MAWKNWSGGQRCDAELVAAHDIDEVLGVIEQASNAQQRLRVVGAGHSFSALVTNDDTVLSLEALAGISDISDDGLAWVGGGTCLRDLGEPLRDAGWALANQGDIDSQSIAGAISTGTHGTGATLTNLSEMVRGLRMATASGTVLECNASSHSEVFEAARCGMGLFGVITDVQMQLVPTYRLHERVWRESPDECVSRLDERIAATRHFEFFWRPQKNQCELKSLDPTDSPPDEMSGSRYEYIDHSDLVFPSERQEKFEEMEFALPAEAGSECFVELVSWLLRRYPELEWPVEYRTVAADDLWLSPARGRATVTISVHQAAELASGNLFSDCESIFKGYDGRPHWGKHHTMSAAGLAPHYPQWEALCDLRGTMDPQSMFMNDALVEIFR